MKKFFKSLFKNLFVDVALIIIFFIGVGIYVLVAGPGIAGAESYTPLATIPGLTDKGVPPSLGVYVNNFYTLSIGIGAVLAVLMIVIGGLQYMTTDNFSNKKDGRTRISNATLGLGLLLASFLILQTINTNLTSLDVDVNVAVNEKKIGVIRSDDGSTSVLLTDKNVDTFLEQQKKQSVQNQEDGFKAAKCAVSSDIPENRSSERLSKDYFECQDKLTSAIEKRGDKNEYRDCVVIDSGIGGSVSRLIQTCYFYRERN